MLVTISLAGRQPPWCLPILTYCIFSFSFHSVIIECPVRMLEIVVC
jgi:hypothetical protein